MNDALGLWPIQVRPEEYPQTLVDSCRLIQHQPRPAQDVEHRKAAATEEPGGTSRLAPNRASHQPLQLPERR